MFYNAQKIGFVRLAESRKLKKNKAKKLTIRPNRRAKNDHKAESTKYVSQIYQKYIESTKYIL